MKSVARLAIRPWLIAAVIVAESVHANLIWGTYVFPTDALISICDMLNGKAGHVVGVGGGEGVKQFLKKRFIDTNCLYVSIRIDELGPAAPAKEMYQ